MRVLVLGGGEARDLPLPERRRVSSTWRRSTQTWSICPAVPAQPRARPRPGVHGVQLDRRRTDRQADHQLPLGASASAPRRRPTSAAENLDCLSPLHHRSGLLVALSGAIIGGTRIALSRGPSRARSSQVYLDTEGVNGLAVGLGSVWVTSGGLTRIDAATGRVIERLDIGGDGGNVVVAGGAVWLAADGRAYVLRISRRSDHGLSPTQRVRALAVRRAVLYRRRSCPPLGRRCGRRRPVARRLQFDDADRSPPSTARADRHRCGPSTRVRRTQRRDADRRTGISGRRRIFRCRSTSGNRPGSCRCIGARHAQRAASRTRRFRSHVVRDRRLRGPGRGRARPGTPGKPVSAICAIDEPGPWLMAGPQVPDCAEGQGRTYLEVGYHSLAPETIHLAAALRSVIDAPTQVERRAGLHERRCQPAVIDDDQCRRPGAAVWAEEAAEGDAAGGGLDDVRTGDRCRTGRLRTTGLSRDRLRFRGSHIRRHHRADRQCRAGRSRAVLGRELLDRRASLPLPPEGTPIAVLMAGGTTKSYVQVAEFQWRGDRH